MIEIAPSILSADFSRLGEDVAAVEKEQIRCLHIDVMDGMFVPSISFGFPIIKSLRKKSKMFFDVHLMIEEPVRYISEFASAGSDNITVHYEACKDVAGTIQAIKRTGCECGLSVKPSTDIEKIYPYLSQVDMILIMTVEPGFGGQSYIEAMTDKIKTLRSYLDTHDLSHIIIEVDGGIYPDNIQHVIKAGANRIVCGSAVFRGDIKSNIQALNEKIKQLQD